MDFKHEGQAEWDGRQFFMTRLHEAILHAHNCNFSNDYLGWFKALSVLRIELSSHLRKAEEKALIESSKKSLNSLLFSNDSLAKLQGFIQAQEDLHSIIRSRGFDVPVNERSPGSSIR